MASKKTTLQPDRNFSFGLKLRFEKRVNAGLDHVHLEHVNDGHNKFYIIQLLRQGNSSITNFTVTIKFGRKGVAGNTKKHGFQTIEDSYKFISKKMAEKLKKGYERIK